MGVDSAAVGAAAASGAVANATPFAVVACPLVEASGRPVVAVIVKGTFGVERSKVVPVEPRPVRMSDVPRDEGDPWSSLRYASDLCPRKHGADVVAVGEAISPRPVAVMDLAIQVRGAAAPLRVHGPRVYYAWLGQVAIGPAAPFERVPLVYEKAYGGRTDDLKLIEPRNPSGAGVAQRPHDLIDRLAPQIEHPAHPIDGPLARPAPAGYGPIPAHWSPRRERAGTFDERWKAERMPLMPLDFDVRHHNVAHPALILDEPLRASDPVAVLGMSPDGLFRFELPALPVVIHARFDSGRKVSVRPEIDTLVLEPAERRFEIAGRHAFPIGRGVEVLRELRVDLDSG
ncbi:DUF2169 family type VI secretion system accessory protein [Sorangium sp. So ce394]|uniref:DUF2169 family type VI secretion system accessory protein n=1 Tax=Sorangium sp. So ce394 TaxID=3133310 RepID=UPI003F5C6691